ncbi:MAG: arsenic metallochaperone ArsD family protein [Candidatus Methanoplasma sp.]|jgi:hypothetical protein|nr:arsenic metallochaperone ArsD family protein [Candidatus Methanoplasma sp.]
MQHKLTVFDSDVTKKRYPDDAKRFDRSLELLSAAGIDVKVVRCTVPSDVTGGGEAEELVAEKGLSVLPLTEYEGAIIADGEYPTDQILADFLNAPDGVLSVNMIQPPPVNDLPPPCSCGSGDKCSNG